VTRRVLYHALVSVHGWSEYERIIGGVYPANGSNSARESPVGYGHDVDIPVVVADPEHPITAGVGNFTVHDEIYWGFRVGSDITPLLRQPAIRIPPGDQASHARPWWTTSGNQWVDRPIPEPRNIL
jgi:type 1 glutamine amidotransferase